MEHHHNILHARCGQSLGAGIVFQQRESCGPAGISKHLREFGKNDDQQRMDLILATMTLKQRRR
ncbi:MAG: hypothetical protein WCD86_05160 [Ktedonobacteraceae bacterium]